MDDAEQMLPSYLRFVRGVIDSADLPLNVSRELLQESRDVKAIREGSTKRILSLLEDLAENKTEDYATFWTEFGQVLKEGTGEDSGNIERIAKEVHSKCLDQDFRSAEEFALKLSVEARILLATLAIMQNKEILR
jgi:HSP90 family molecular chaperone